MSESLEEERLRVQRQIEQLERTLSGAHNNIVLSTDDEDDDDDDDDNEGDDEVEEEPVNDAVSLSEQRLQVQREIQQLENALGQDTVVLSDEDDDSDESGSELDLPVNTESCLQMNMVYQQILQEKLQQLESLLQDNKHQQRELEAQLSGPIRAATTPQAQRSSQVKLFLGHFLKPYFKDKLTGLGPPANPESKEKAKNMTQYLDHKRLKLKRWEGWQKTLLIHAVAEDRMKRLIKPKLNKIDYLTQKLSSFQTEDTKLSLPQQEDIKQQIDQLEKDIHTLKSQNEEELVGDRYDNHDWDKISNIDFEGTREAQDICRFWQNVLHPSIDKTRWSQKEIDRLEELAEKHQGRDWEKIAEELGTNRTAFMCLQMHQRYVSKTFKNNIWTEEEDQALSELVEKMRMGNFIPYTQISYFMDGREPVQLMYRWNGVLDPSLRKGPWIPEEDELLLHAVSRFGEKNWWRIRMEVPGRTDGACRDRYYDCLKPGTKRGAFDENERRLLLMGVQKYGVGRWSKIAAEIPNRIDCQCMREWWKYSGKGADEKRRSRRKKSLQASQQAGEAAPPPKPRRRANPADRRRREAAAAAAAAAANGEAGQQAGEEGQKAAPAPRPRRRRQPAKTPGKRRRKRVKKEEETSEEDSEEDDTQVVYMDDSDEDDKKAAVRRVEERRGGEEAQAEVEERPGGEEALTEERRGVEKAVQTEERQEAEEEEKAATTEVHAVKKEHPLPPMEEWLPRTRVQKWDRLNGRLVERPGPCSALPSAPPPRKEGPPSGVRCTVVSPQGVPVDSLFGQVPKPLARWQRHQPKALIQVGAVHLNSLMQRKASSIPTNRAPTRGVDPVMQFRLMAAVTPWIGNLLLPPPRPERGAADHLRERGEELHLSSTPVFLLLLKTLRVDLTGCMGAIQARTGGKRFVSLADSLCAPSSKRETNPKRTTGMSEQQKKSVKHLLQQQRQQLVHQVQAPTSQQQEVTRQPCPQSPRPQSPQPHHLQLVLKQPQKSNTPPHRPPPHVLMPIPPNMLFQYLPLMRPPAMRAQLPPVPFPLRSVTQMRQPLAVSMSTSTPVSMSSNAPVTMSSNAPVTMSSNAPVTMSSPTAVQAVPLPHNPSAVPPSLTNSSVSGASAPTVPGQPSVSSETTSHASSPAEEKSSGKRDRPDDMITSPGEACKSGKRQRKLTEKVKLLQEDAASKVEAKEKKMSTPKRKKEKNDLHPPALLPPGQSLWKMTVDGLVQVTAGDQLPRGLKLPLPPLSSRSTPPRNVVFQQLIPLSNGSTNKIQASPTSVPPQSASSPRLPAPLPGGIRPGQLLIFPGVLPPPPGGPQPGGPRPGCPPPGTKSPAPSGSSSQPRPPTPTTSVRPPAVSSSSPLLVGSPRPALHVVRHQTAGSPRGGPPPPGPSPGPTALPTGSSLLPRLPPSPQPRPPATGPPSFALLRPPGASSSAPFPSTPISVRTPLKGAANAVPPGAPARTPLRIEPTQLDPSLMFTEPGAEVQRWMSGRRGVAVPGSDVALPYLPPFISNLRTLCALLKARRSLVDKALLSEPGDPKPSPARPGPSTATTPGRVPDHDYIQTSHPGEDERVAAVRHLVAERFAANPAFQLLKARFLSCFTVPALLATVQPNIDLPESCTANEEEEELRAGEAEEEEEELRDREAEEEEEEEELRAGEVENVGSENPLLLMQGSPAAHYSGIKTRLTSRLLATEPPQTGPMDTGTEQIEIPDKSRP